MYPIAGGEFWFPGVRSGLKDHFRDVPPRVSKFSLYFSIDGLPLHKSTRKQFWPILMSIQEMPEVPVLMVGNFFGESKPKSVEEYLRPLVDELNGLMDNGIVIANKLIEIHVRAFITDSPARAFIKGSVYFNHTHGCQKCTVQGRYHSAHRVTCFPGMDHPARTHEDFVQSNYGAHHREKTPLMDLKNLRKQIIIADRLHLFDYGVTRTMLKGWKSGKLGGGAKWSEETISKIYALLKEVELPLEFHRKLRSVEDIGLWKASEFQMFLHYASFIVLKDVLTDVQYDHFMKYYCAVTLLSSEVYKNDWLEAKRLLREFVLEYGVIYGEHCITSNIHSLLHVYDDVDTFGPLYTISSYPFESKLQHVKNCLRNGHKVLVQAANRISEQNPHIASSSTTNPSFPFLKTKTNGVALHINRQLTLSPGFQSNWFLTHDNYIVKYCSAEQKDSTIKINGRAFNYITETLSYYISPFMKDIYEENISNLRTDEMVFLPRDIKCKLVAIKTTDNFLVLVPFLRTLTE
ncbi:uncharacterized protein LOC121602871 isoform X1 [Anopheles merus]|nr:uncharacterized protein LOC121602871 isoform X1 [Anopheles merus]XP_041787562.1 uncharacterized protein LOC121602871 isoform X1 [Anopheles merus]